MPGRWPDLHHSLSTARPELPRSAAIIRRLSDRVGECATSAQVETRGPAGPGPGRIFHLDRQAGVPKPGPTRGDGRPRGRGAGGCEAQRYRPGALRSVRMEGFLPVWGGFSSRSGVKPSLHQSDRPTEPRSTTTRAPPQSQEPKQLVPCPRVLVFSPSPASPRSLTKRPGHSWYARGEGQPSSLVCEGRRPPNSRGCPPELRRERNAGVRGPAGTRWGDKRKPPAPKVGPGALAVSR